MEPAELYAFAFRGLLADFALEKTERRRRAALRGRLDPDVLGRLPLDQLPNELVTGAARMGAVYVAIAAFENSVREFLSKRLLESKGAGWWEASVSERIKSRAKARQADEEVTKWHGQRGDSPVNFIDMSDLGSIIAQNWDVFEPHLQSLEWAKQIVNVVERSRNVIMHSGSLGSRDVERVASAIRDWVQQVGA